MKNVSAIAAAVLLVCAAFAISPSARLNKVRNCTVLAIREVGKDPVEVAGKHEAREMLKAMKIDTSRVKDYIIGKPDYMIECFRGDKKPEVVIWAMKNGLWGFKNVSGAFGVDEGFIKWLQTKLKK